MVLPSISPQDKEIHPVLLSPGKSSTGFTLIEVLIAVGILAIILSLGLFISFDFYRGYSFRAEKSVIVSVLQKARNQALNNISQARHGVRFENSPALRYIIFEGSTYDQNSASNIIINASYGISITNPAPLPFDVIFDQLNGNCISSNCSSGPLAITVSDGVKSYDITINSEGRINW
ncbi:MAG: type II secretion system protein [bacterium]|nr:type II secretion system protein [bacterium]